MLAHIRIKAGAEERWEALIADLVDKTLANEPDVVRYEYWKAASRMSGTGF